MNRLIDSILLTLDSLALAQDNPVPSAPQHRSYSKHWVLVLLEIAAVLVLLERLAGADDCIPHFAECHIVAVEDIHADRHFEFGSEGPGTVVAIE